MSLEQLEKIRRFELDAIIETIRGEVPDGARILDIGAGAGWQARIVSDAGYAVEAIDMPTSVYAQNRVFAICDYDGLRIPFPDAAFDAIYSSNVLEHVAHADVFQEEIRRVLKPDGVAVHVVPSGSWRFWSNLAHYPYIVKAVFRRLRGTDGESGDMITIGTKERAPRTVGNTLRRIFIPNRDGEVGNAWTEIWHFSRWRWTRLFQRNGWWIENRKSNGLFYTGYSILDKALSIRARSRLSRLMGGSCHVFVLRPNSPGSGAARENIKVQDAALSPKDSSTSMMALIAARASLSTVVPPPGSLILAARLALLSLSPRRVPAPAASVPISKAPLAVALR